MDVLYAVLFLVVVKFSRRAVLLAVDGVLQCVCPVGVCFDSFDVLCHNDLFILLGGLPLAELIKNVTSHKSHCTKPDTYPSIFEPAN